MNINGVKTVLTYASACQSAANLYFVESQQFCVLFVAKQVRDAFFLPLSHSRWLLPMQTAPEGRYPATHSFAHGGTARTGDFAMMSPRKRLLIDPHGAWPRFRGWTTNRLRPSTQSPCRSSRDNIRPRFSRKKISFYRRDPRVVSILTGQYTDWIWGNSDRSLGTLRAVEQCRTESFLCGVCRK